MEDMYLKIGDIEGEAQGDLAAQISVLSWNFGAKQSATSHSGAPGGGAAAATVRDVQVRKRVDKASPNLFACCTAGTHIADALLTVRKAGGGQIEYFKIFMEAVIISSYDLGVGVGANEEIEEVVTLNCARMKIEYAPQEEPGAAGGTLEGGWDMAKRKAFP